jgi:ribosome-associated protein YbcJ (S4-like RNA binding protein)
MKKSELKEMIKAAFLSEADFTNAQDDDAALQGMYDPTVNEGEEDLDQMLARISEEEVEEGEDKVVDPYLAEAEEEEEEDIDVDAGEEVEDEGGEEEETTNDSIVVDKKIVSLSSLPQDTRKILDTLETLRAQAEEFGDQKFITQVGNTITFFTRDFVVAGDEPTRAKVDESLEILKMKKLAGLLTEGEYAKALLRENQTNFPSEDEIKRKGAVGDSVTVSKDGKNYDINYTISSESDDEMSFGIYDSEEGEDAEQIEEFYTYKELINWFNN